MKKLRTLLILIGFLLIFIIVACAQQQSSSQIITNKETPKISPNNIQILSAEWNNNVYREKICKTNKESLRIESDWTLTINANLPTNVEYVTCSYLADGVDSGQGFILKSGVNKYGTFSVDPKKDVTIGICCSVNEDGYINKRYDACVSYVLKPACK